MKPFDIRTRIHTRTQNQLTMENTEETIYNAYTEHINESAKKNGLALEKLLNSSNAYPKQTGEQFAESAHRFIQLELWRMIEGVIEQNSKNHALGRYDDRNAYAVKMSAKIAPLLDKFRQEIAKGI